MGVKTCLRGSISDEVGSTLPSQHHACRGSSRVVSEGEVSDPIAKKLGHPGEKGLSRAGANTGFNKEIHSCAQKKVQNLDQTMVKQRILVRWVPGYPRGLHLRALLGPR